MNRSGRCLALLFLIPLGASAQYAAAPPLELDLHFHDTGYRIDELGTWGETYTDVVVDEDT
ncbi:MAG: hypothetical protein DWQ08_07535, partial [Proteobacteria bacterium]